MQYLKIPFVEGTDGKEGHSFLNIGSNLYYRPENTVGDELLLVSDLVIEEIMKYLVDEDDKDTNDFTIPADMSIAELMGHIEVGDAEPQFSMSDLQRALEIVAEDKPTIADIEEICDIKAEPIEEGSSS